MARLGHDSPVRSLLEGRLHIANARPDDAREALDRAHFTNPRDQLGAQVLYTHVAVARGDDPDQHLDRVVELAAPEGLVRVVLEEGDVITRLVRRAAEASGMVEAERLAIALGSPPRGRHETNTTTSLSERELEVLRYLPTRLTNQEIAGECAMSVNTVKAHLKRIYNKFGVSSRAEAVDRARLLGDL